MHHPIRIKVRFELVQYWTCHSAFLIYLFIFVYCCFTRRCWGEIFITSRHIFCDSIE